MASTPLVDWPVPPAPIAEPRTEVQLYAIAIGGSVPALLAGVAYWLDGGVIAAIAACGIPIGAVLAVEGAGRMLAPTWRTGVLRAGLLAPLAAAAVILLGVLGWGLFGAASASLEGVLGALVVAVLVVVVAMLVGTPITLPSALVVAWLLRRAARMDRGRARLHVGALVAAAVALGAVTLHAAGETWGLLSGGWTG